MKKIIGIGILLLLFFDKTLEAQIPDDARLKDRIYLDSKDGHNGDFSWKMKKAGEITTPSESLSDTSYADKNWLPAIVPGTVLHSLVFNKIYPEPYFGINNRLGSGLIPDIAEKGRDFYTYWFHTSFVIPESYQHKNVWLQVDGINYRAEVWVNGNLVTNISGMFQQSCVDITDFAHIGAKNGLAIKVYPVDIPGTNKAKPWRARGENKNGGDGNIGLNTTMLMSVGWDFTFKDGIRDRNTGIWKSISLFATDKVSIRHPFVKSAFPKPGYHQANETLSVELVNAAMKTVKCRVKAEIAGESIQVEKTFSMIRGEEKKLVFSPEEFPQLQIQNPRLWWPVFKGKPELYEAKFTVYVDGMAADSVKTKFGIREITVDRNAPDSSKNFYVNGKKIFIRGANWIPEGMLRNSDARTYAELRYTKQSGINFLRLWGGGIAESDYFYQLCDEFGFLVWQEFWLTGDTKHPEDRDLYFANLTSTVKRIRNHPCLAIYVASNESTEVSGTKEILEQLDGTRPYQMQSETDGVHDGSPYQQVNPMQHYENTASDRGSRVDGFNPEYGAPSLPTVEILRETMPEKDLWPINKDVWDYMDGNGFHNMTTKYKALVDNYGPSASIDEFAKKAQLVNAINAKSIWEVWNYNKFGYGDRYCSGLLFWYLNSPVRQVCARMWDWSLEPTASLYYTANALEPLHAQFDYLKNTVSVYNDYFRSFSNYLLVADVYDLNSKKILSKSMAIPVIGEDAVLNDLIRLDFPVNSTPVQFIRLGLRDATGKEVANSFYWRSSDKYLGKKTMTGPATGGFAALNQMKTADVQSRFTIRTTNDETTIGVHLKNTSSQIAFFNQLQLLDATRKPIRPSFYSDNFFTLMPGEEKDIRIQTFNKEVLNEATSLVIKGWNTKEFNYFIHK